MSNSFQDWIKQGESLYNTALKEFQDIQSKIEELEAALAAKQAEVNQIAQVIGKTSVETQRKAVADIIPAKVEEIAPTGTPSSNATIARALTGRFGR